MFKLAMAHLKNPELIQYESIFFKFIQVHENKEYQAVTLTKQSKHVLYFIPTINTKNNTRQ